MAQTVFWKYIKAGFSFDKSACKQVHIDRVAFHNTKSAVTKIPSGEAPPAVESKDMNETKVLHGRLVQSSIRRSSR